MWWGLIFLVFGRPADKFFDDKIVNLLDKPLNGSKIILVYNLEVFINLRWKGSCLNVNEF